MNRSSRDLQYSQQTFSQKGSIAYSATEGGQQKSSSRLYATRIEIDVKCTPKQVACISDALPHEIVVYQPPEKRGFEAHAHLSFLSRYIQENVASMDFSGLSVKVVGPKFNKKEVCAYTTAREVHFCLKDPLRTDEFRVLSSERALELLIRRTRQELEISTSILSGAKKDFEKVNVAHSAADINAIRMRIEELGEEAVKIENKKNEIVKYEEWKRLLTCSGEVSNSSAVCTGGVESCSKAADIIISNDSLYDVDLPELVSNATKCGVKEIWACAILPFGLKFVESYYSSELDVHFKRLLPARRPLHSEILRSAYAGLDPTGIAAIVSWAQTFGACLKSDHTAEAALGFEMWHGSDMSNGYMHSNESFMKLLYTNFVVSLDRVVWAYEIVQNVAEICAIRFVRMDTTIPKQIVRKEMPSKFNDYVVYYNPLKYFAKFPEYELIMLPKKKLDGAIYMVYRAESPNKIVEKLSAHVQASFLKVDVGGVTLQEGGDASPYDLDAIILIALIEGNYRKYEVGEAWKRSRDSAFGVLGKIFEELVRSTKALIAHNFPRTTKFFTESRAKKFYSSRYELASSNMHSAVDTRSFSFWWEHMKALGNDMLRRACLEKYTLVELVQNPALIKDEFLKAEGREQQRRRISKHVSNNDALLRERLEKNRTERRAIEDSIAAMSERLRQLEDFTESIETAEENEESMAAALDVEGEDSDAEVTVFKYPAAAFDSVVSTKGSVPPQSALVARDRIVPKFLPQTRGGIQRKSLSTANLTGVQLQRARRNVGAESGVQRTTAADGTQQSGVRAMSARESKKFSKEAIALELDKALHEPFSFCGNIPWMDAASEKAFEFNSMRRDGNRIKLLDEPAKRVLREAFTVRGRNSPCIVDEEEARRAVRDIYRQYFVESGYDIAEKLRGCKLSMQALARRIYNGGDFSSLASKNLRVINGYAGSGKTSYALAEFDVATCTYIVPFAGVLSDTRDAVKAKYRNETGEEVSVDAKTFENIAREQGELSIKASGDKLIIDECSGIPYELILLIILATDYKEYILIGDMEQTQYFDTLGSLAGKQFTELVPSDCVTVFRFTYRYGPTVAAYLNYALNYPVVSLRNEDTRLVYHSVEELGAGVPGFNVCISSKVRAKYEKLLTNINCAGSTQGRTVERCNNILAGEDAHDYLAFRSGGIVAGSRATTELHLYLNLQSKNKKSTDHLLDFATNYATLFDVVIPVVSDFQ